MHFGLLLLGLLGGGTAAIAILGHGSSLHLALLAYVVFGFGAVCFAALIWAIGPTIRPASLSVAVKPPGPGSGG